MCHLKTSMENDKFWWNSSPNMESQEVHNSKMFKTYLFGPI